MVTPSVILLLHPGPSSSCFFYGLLLARSHSCGTTRARLLLPAWKPGWNGSAVMRHLSIFLLTCLQFIRAEVGGWLNLKPDLIFRKEVSFHLKRNSTSLQRSHVPWDHLPRSSGTVFFTSWCCLDFWEESAVALGESWGELLG